MKMLVITKGLHLNILFLVKKAPRQASFIWRYFDILIVVFDWFPCLN